MRGDMTLVHIHDIDERKIIDTLIDNHDNKNLHKETELPIQVVISPYGKELVANTVYYEGNEWYVRFDYAPNNTRPQYGRNKEIPHTCLDFPKLKEITSKANNAK